MFARTAVAPVVARKVLGSVSEAVAAAPLRAHLAQAVAAFNPKAHAAQCDSEFEWGDMCGESQSLNGQFASAINGSLACFSGGAGTVDHLTCSLD